LPTENQIVIERNCLIFCFYIGLYDFKLSNCSWMCCEILSERSY